MMNDRIKNMEKPSAENTSLEGEEAGDASLLKSVNGIKNTEAKETKKSAGKVLKKSRENQGISLEIVHEATKIPMDALRAIEEGYKIRMLSPFYYRGFLKMYANYLNIDVSEVIDDYKQEELPEHIKQDIEDFQTPKWIADIFTRQRMRQIVITVGIFLALFVIFKLIGFLTSREPKPAVTKEAIKKEAGQIEVAGKKIKKIVQQPRKEVRQMTPKIITPKEILKVVAPTVISQPSKPLVKAPSAVVQKNVILTVRANQNSWLRVKTDGMVVFQSTLKIGAVETWLANDEIEISGRNINQLEFELNGKMIGTLGRKDRNAKKVVITKRGLSVKQ